jgi:hypothetical protein
MLLQVGNELSGLASPCQMTSQARVFVHDFMCYVSEAIYPPEFAIKPDLMKAVWFKYMMVDEAYFHCFVALSEACIDFIIGKERCSNEYRHHIATALRLINSKLSGDQAVSDTNIAGVTAICVLSSIRDQPWQTKVHFDGLCRMIEVRGGMETLLDTPALCEKAFRTDIDLALQLACAPQLHRSAKKLDAIVPIFSNPAFEVRSPLMNAVRNADMEVFVAAQNIMKMSRIFNSRLATRKLDPMVFQDIITTLCYRLLDIDSVVGTKLVSPVAKAIHRGLLAFMTTFLLQIGRARSQRYQHLSQQLKSALENEQFRTSVDPASQLWLLVVAGISVLDESEIRTWLAPRLTQVLDQFGMYDWQFAKRLLSKYPWMTSLHDQHGFELWQMCFPDSTIED